VVRPLRAARQGLAAGEGRGAARIGGALGTALIAIILQRTIAAGLPGIHGSIQAIAALSQQLRATAAPALANAFGTSFWVGGRSDLPLNGGARR
jgi:hypothetical protein